MGGVSLCQTPGDHCKLSSSAWAVSPTVSLVFPLTSAQVVHEAAECDALLSMLSALTMAPVFCVTSCAGHVLCGAQLLNAEQLLLSLRACVTERKLLLAAGPKYR